MSDEGFRVIDGMDQGILVTDREQRVSFSNSFAANLFGGDPTGQTVDQLRSKLSPAFDGDPPETIRGEVLVENSTQGRQTRCYVNIAPLSRSDADDRRLVWTFFELTDEIANTRAFTDFAAQLAVLRRDLRRQSEEILQLLRTDSLTGCANRAAVWAVLEKGLEFSDARGGDLSVVLFDLDGFARLNDHRGHGVADGVLGQVAALTGHELGAVGTVGRWEGDAFLVVVPGADQEQARSFAEELRARIQKETKGLGLPLTATLGVAIHRPGQSADELVRTAQHAVGEGKAAGGNRVLVAL